MLVISIPKLSSTSRVPVAGQERSEWGEPHVSEGGVLSFEGAFFVRIMVCREMLKEDCLMPVYGMFYFLWFPELCSHSSKSKVTLVGVGRGEKFQAKLMSSWILSMKRLKCIRERLLLRL